MKLIPEILLGALLIVTISGLSLAQDPDYTIVTEADTYISGRNDGNYVHGHPDSTGDNYTMLVIKNEGEPVAGNGYYREILLRFNLSEVQEEIDKVVLRLFCRGKGETAPDTIKYGCYYIADDNWEETTVTWNIAPVPDFDNELDVGLFATTIEQTGTAIENGVEVEKTHYGWTIGGELDAAKIEKERTGDSVISIDMWARTKKMSWEDPDTWNSFVSKDSAAISGLDIAPQLLIWKKGSSAISNQPQPIPTEYALEANFPNPFNPSTTIRYALKENGVTMLKIFNILGQDVRTLTNIPNTVGWHTVKWDGMLENGRPAPSGIYFYELTSGEFKSIQKMVLSE